MASNPTIDPTAVSETVIKDVVRPGLADYAGANGLGADDVDRSGTKTPPLVVTSFPDQLRYPHIVVDEDSDSGAPVDRRLDFHQHDFAIGVTVAGRTSTEMFRLKDGVRGYFLENRQSLRDEGLSELEIDGGPRTWDESADVIEWELTVTGRLYTHPDTNA